MRKNTVEVFLNEEYGYKCWIWRPNMNEEEFSSWWQNLSESDIIKYYFNIKALPGTLKEYTEKNYESLVSRSHPQPRFLDFSIFSTQFTENRYSTKI